MKIKGLQDNLNAILKLCIENNILIRSQNEFMLENINNGRSYEENTKDFSSIASEQKEAVLSHLFLQSGALNLKDILGYK